MAADPMLEEVRVTIFMESLLNNAAKKEVFRLYSSTFKETEAVALNVEYSFEYARLGYQPRENSLFSTAEPINLSYAKEEAKLQAVEQRGSIRRCYTCRSTGHSRARCTLRCARQAVSRKPVAGNTRGAGTGNAQAQLAWGALLGWNSVL